MNLFLVFLIISLAVVTECKRHDSMEEGNDEGSFEESFAVSGFDLSGSLRKEFALEAALSDLDRNFICSPLSALLPLAKLILGTERANSRKELLHAIGVPQTKIKSRFKKLLHELRYLPGVNLTIASRLYVSKNIRLDRQYAENTKSVFKSSIEKIDLGAPIEAAETINNWVRTETRDKINDIVSAADMSPSSSIILVNAIYFAGQWQDPFKKVYAGGFHTPQGIRKIPMMHRKGSYKYTKSSILHAQIIEIPYVDEKASFVIVLPQSKTGLPMLLRELKVAPSLLNKAMKNMVYTTVTLTIPKFKIQTELDLRELYQKIGIHDIFRPTTAALGRITNDTAVFVSKAIQKTIIEVTEKGSVAAAASATEILDVVQNHRPVNLTVDHPFLFFVKFEAQQLFAGCLNR